MYGSKARLTHYICTSSSRLSDSASFADYEYVENPPLHLLSLIFPIEFKDGANENAGVDPQVRMIKLSDLISRLVSAACIDAVTLYADQVSYLLCWYSMNGTNNTAIVIPSCSRLTLANTYPCRAK